VYILFKIVPLKKRKGCNDIIDNSDLYILDCTVIKLLLSNIDIQYECRNDRNVVTQQI
jgi:hypothetical protein